MSVPAEREALRRLLQARRLYEAARDHYDTGDELAAEARRLTDEAKALEAGRWPLPTPPTVLPDLRH